MQARPAWAVLGVFSAALILGGCTGGTSITSNTPEGSVSVSDKGIQATTDSGSASISGGDTRVSTAESNTSASNGATKKNLVVVFDASGSMNTMLGGEKKIDIAKRSIEQYIQKLGSEVNLSVVAYGQVGSSSQADKQRSCNGIEEVYYFGPVNSQIATAKVSTLPANGWTPIAKSLEKAKSILASHPGEDNSILLVSDGEETCGGDPLAAAKQICDGKMRVNVVGFDVTGNAEAQLKNISASGCGGYVSVDDSNDFNVVIGNGTLNAITPGAAVSINGGKIDVQTDGVKAVIDGGKLNVDTGTSSVKIDKGVPKVTVPDVSTSMPNLGF